MTALSLFESLYDSYSTEVRTHLLTVQNNQKLLHLLQPMYVSNVKYMNYFRKPTDNSLVYYCTCKLPIQLIGPD